MIQYCHVRNYEVVFSPSAKFDDYNSLNTHVAPHGGQTIALEVIEPWFFDTLEVGTFFEKKVGVARCSDEDNYNKKTGRELSLSRMKNKKLTVEAKKGNEHSVVVVLVDEASNRYVLRKNSQYNRVHFVEYCDA